jgi:hypothetical protein
MNSHFNKWQDYLKIDNDGIREQQFFKILSGLSLAEKEHFLLYVLNMDSSPFIRINAGKNLLELLKEKALSHLITAFLTDPMKEGQAGLMRLLMPFITFNRLPYAELDTEPWVLDKLLEIYS